MESNIKSRPTAERLTTEFLRERLAGTKLPRDPLAVTPPPGSDQWPRSMLQRLGTGLKPAGVLIPIVEQGAQLSVLLTQRAADLKHHPGQVSFPGGRMEEHDRDVSVTALRETYEEVGIEPGQVAVIGYLDSMPTITGYAVTPVVGLIQGPAHLSIDRTEVDYAFEVPLDFLLNPDNDRPVEREFEGRTVTMTELHYGGQRIWGATAMMLQLFRKKLLNQ